MKILHLFNTYKTYDMIERGEKPEEYRNIAYWKKRICKYGNPNHVDKGRTVCNAQCPFFMPKCRISVPTDYTHVCFHRAYTSTTMTWKIDRVCVGKGNPKWGAPKEYVYIIKLKERVVI